MEYIGFISIDRIKTIMRLFKTSDIKSQKLMPQKELFLIIQSDTGAQNIVTQSRGNI